MKPRKRHAIFSVKTRFQTRDLHGVLIDGRAWSSEGTEANNFSAVYDAWPSAGNFFREFVAAPEIAGRYKPESHVFALEGSSIDRCVTLNYGIRDEQS